MNKSIFIAKVMALFLLILNLSILLNANHTIQIITAFFQNIALQFIVGMILVIVGALLVVSHNVWESSWVVIVTILSWLILIKGIIYLMFPSYIQAVGQQFTVLNSGLYISAGLNIIIALFLFYMAFIHSKKYIT